MTGHRLAVFGAREASLGEAVAEQAILENMSVRTYGISGDEMRHMNVGGARWLTDLMEFAPDFVLSTIGYNRSGKVTDGGFNVEMVHSFGVNVLKPLEVLAACAEIGTPMVYAAISSNSANIARRGSTPYCASKAALSMALRCAARDRVLGEDGIIYGYEPGLIKGTQMTADTEARFGPSQTRMIGAESGLDKVVVAERILRDFLHADISMNGVMFRLDAGEQ